MKSYLLAIALCVSLSLSAMDEAFVHPAPPNAVKVAIFFWLSVFAGLKIYVDHERLTNFQGVSIKGWMEASPEFLCDLPIDGHNVSRCLSEEEIEGWNCRRLMDGNRLVKHCNSLAKKEN